MDSDLIIISKMDLAEAVDFSMADYLRDLKNINRRAKILNTSKKEKVSFKEVAHFIEHERMHILNESHGH
jgi:Ni2+-binding GTPase involved in maturation of urease and hydrogenase